MPSGKRRLLSVSGRHYETEIAEVQYTPVTLKGSLYAMDEFTNACRKTDALVLLDFIMYIMGFRHDGFK